ncbi:MAG TPA: TonB-dependent receptor [Pyrinomonadaceae bacterium]|jgi:iron complex outermembrane receptor protein
MKRVLFAKIVVALAAACAAAYVAPAQTRAGGASSVTGRVVDPQGAGLAGALVTLYAREPLLRLTATTDASGAYRFERLAPGEYLVEADARGFAPAPAQKIRLREGERANADVRLEVAGLRAEVVVTASDTAQAVDEVSKSLTTVTPGEAEERDEYSVAEALRTVPGLRVQQLGGPGAFFSIKTRGLRNQDTAILFDGLRFRDPAAPQGDASGYLSDLDIVNLARVEVLRGSGSSLYGTNAVGGVINVVTDEGGPPTRGQLLFEGGSLGFFRGRAQLAGGTSANRVAYSAGVSHRNVTRGVDGDDAARNTSGQGRVLFRLTPKATLTARGYASDSFLQLNDDPRPVVGGLPSGVIDARPVSRAELRRFESGASASGLANADATFVPSANDPDASRATRFFSGALSLNHRPRESFGYTISYQATTTDGTFRDGPGGTVFEPFGNTRSDFDGRAQTLNARADFLVGAHNFVTAGYEFEREAFVNRQFPESAADNFVLDVAERSHAVFVQDQLRLLGDRLQLSAALRAQSFTLLAPRFTPAASSPFAGAAFVSPPRAYTGDGSIAYFFPSSGTKLRAHVGNGYRAPSLFERFGSSFSDFFGSSTFGDPSLAPERSVAFDAGVDQRLAGDRARASATYFYTRLQEVIDFGPVPAPRFFGFFNTGGGLARGAELSLDAAPARALDVRAAYTYTNSDAREPRFGQIRAFAIPDHQFSLVATARAGRRAFFNFDLSATSDYLATLFDPLTFGNRVYRFDGLLKADAGASYRLPLAESRALRFFGVVENIFGRDYYESGFRTPGRTARAGAQFNF